MANRWRVVLALALLGLTGCVTYTAHQLPILSNPLREEAADCEAACQASDTSPGRVGYALCLDHCPGARVSVGYMCPNPKRPGEVCAQTAKTNNGAVAAGVVGGILLGLIVLLVVAAGALGHSFENGGRP